ncbi:hypothetical protein BDV25DRAFT_139932 [Aspergillus avenaceus]|uniref:Nudix hydrolase domain-containing protein n=1 Tax=Aspergillus avenaceus TaxID=36643 RepID=A0A5N6TVF8_ASPAV|nr:hypothetical protein BDV25DRAFT_139932 [Aspergillus avenaceus]
MTTQITKRAVVSCFLFRFTPDHPTPSVALFKRSDKVRTYPNHYAPISGSIDPTDSTPLQTAYREIQEETTLTPPTITLYRTGQPFTFSDASIAREWTIHPFAFILKKGGEASINIDWEHERWEWFDPVRIMTDQDLNTVPRLKDSLGRVYFEATMNEKAGRALAMGLDRLRCDRESGARELLRIALGVFRDFIVFCESLGDDLNPNSATTSTNIKDKDKEWEKILEASYHIIKNGRETMSASIQSTLLSILSEMTSTHLHPSTLLSLLDAHIHRPNTIKPAFNSYTTTSFPQTTTTNKSNTLTILTTSSSSTIRDCILSLHAEVQSLELRILESRPLFEGTTLASSLLSSLKSSPHKNHTKIKIYTDASAAQACQGVDMVLLGADLISATKGVSNKTGSLPLVLCARHVSPGAKVVVLSEIEKVNALNEIVDDEVVERNHPLEVMSAWRSDGVKGVKVLEDGMGSESDGVSVEVENVYFEWVPLHMVDAFVCQEGVLGVDGIVNRSRVLGGLAQRFFG